MSMSISLVVKAMQCNAVTALQYKDNNINKILCYRRGDRAMPL